VQVLLVQKKQVDAVGDMSAAQGSGGQDMVFAMKVP
jgi:hypothetical protein